MKAKSNYRRLLSVLVCLALVLALSPVGAFAEGGNEAVADVVSVNATIVHNFVGGTRNGESQSQSVTLYVGEGYTVTPVEHEGYSFTGDTIYATAGDADKSFTVNYYYIEPVNQKYTVTYQYNDGTVDSTEEWYEGTVTKLKTDYIEKPGYTFQGWTCSSVTISEVDGVKMYTVPANNITFIGSYTKNACEYTVETYTQNVDGSYTCSSEPEDSTVDTDVSVSPNAPYGFKLNESKSVLSAKTVVSGTQPTLKVYYDRLVNTVSYYVDGVLFKEVSYRFGSNVVLPDVPAKAGYEIKGWDNGSEVVNGSLVMPANDLELTAKYGVAGGVEFTVVTYRQNADGQFVESVKWTDFGTTNELTKVTAPELEGYEAHAVVQQRIKADGSTVVKVYYDLVGTEYTVITYLQGEDGAFAESSSAKGFGTIGELTKVTAPQIDGYSCDKVLQQRVKADGSTVVKLYYSLNELPAAEAAAEAVTLAAEAEEAADEADTDAAEPAQEEIAEEETPLAGPEQSSSGAVWYGVAGAGLLAVFFILFFLKRKKDQEEQAEA